MKEYLLKINQWWLALSPKEKKYRLVAIGLSVIFISYEIIYAPMLDYLHDLRDQIMKQQQLLTWIETADATINHLQYTAQDKHFSSSTFLNLIQEHIKNDQLDAHVLHLRQISNNVIAISFAKVNFDQLMRLFISLNEQHIIISQLSVTTAHSAGLVDANVMLHN